MFFDRDISWLSFNFRVLQEARKEQVPLYERIQFLSIFSSNLDEFFRVRYPGLMSLADTAEGAEVANQVQKIVNNQLPIFGKTLKESILPELKQKKVHLYYNEPINEVHQEFIRHFFKTKVLAFIQPVNIGRLTEPIQLENNALYFFVTVNNIEFYLVNIPVPQLSRFVVLPKLSDQTEIVFIDDVIRTCLDIVFPNSEVNECVSIKMTRNADIDIEDEWNDMFEAQVLDMILKREKGSPTRLLYQAGIADTAKQKLKALFSIDDNAMVEGGRYHNLKDLAKLPNPFGSVERYAKQPAKAHAFFRGTNNIFDAIEKKDEMLHLPYHNYDTVLRFFNEAAIDPFVTEVSVTLYRVAHDSYITNALISAAKNGKSVTAFVELKARFDEENNLRWAKKMKAAGVKIVYSIPKMKVHVKLAIVKRKIGHKARYYSLLSTGNFNENTAKFYTDHILLTSNKEITREVDMLFTYLKSRQQPKRYPFLRFEHLLVAGFNFLERFKEMVEREIANKQSGMPARIIIKVNNLQERAVINLLYKASKAGVKIDLIVRGICCLVPGKAGLSEHITVRRIVGRYLEHSRLFIFHNNGAYETYVGSADLMNRNIHKRVEVVFPVTDSKLKKELLEITDIHLKDNVQATILETDGTHTTVVNNTQALHAQDSIYQFVSEIN